jgi:pimeloyl-ACP methyl ester carboxylesterase
VTVLPGSPSLPALREKGRNIYPHANNRHEKKMKTDQSQQQAVFSRRASLGGPLRLRDEGSFFVNGRVVPSQWPNVPNTGMDAPGHTTLEQMYVQYRIPETPNGLPPLVMVHGSNHTGATWETTPDGREGWATWFVRQGFSVYVVDHSGRGRSGFAAARINRAPGEAQAADLAVPLATHERAWVNFRIGPRYLEAFPGSQFPFEHFTAYSAQLVPNTEVTLETGGGATVAALVALLDAIGPAIVMVHSQSGAYGMDVVRRRPERVSAFVNIEGDMAPVTAEEVTRFARVPTLSLWGDYSVGAPGRNGDTRRNGCRDTVEAIAGAGGRAHFLLLPEAGLSGNSHMLMMDRNNLEIAERVSGWLRESLGSK